MKGKLAKFMTGKIGKKMIFKWDDLPTSKWSLQSVKKIDTSWDEAHR